jgi:hypothetical protein
VTARIQFRGATHYARAPAVLSADVGSIVVMAQIASHAVKLALLSLVNMQYSTPFIYRYWREGIGGLPDTPERFVQSVKALVLNIGEEIAEDHHGVLAKRIGAYRMSAITDQKVPAYKLAEATLAALRGDLEAIDRAFKELKPTTKTLTRAYTLCLNTQPFSQSAATRLILSTLQYQLAEKTARRLNVLTGVPVFLTLLLTGFGIFDVYMQLHKCR